MRLLAPRPERLPKELKIPIVTLGTSIEWWRQTDLAGLTTYYDLSRGYDTAGGITYGEPHLIWMQDGSKNLGKRVNWVRGCLGRNERPATQNDGIALAIVTLGFRGNLLENHSIDLPGTTVESGGTPYLYDSARGPVLDNSVGGTGPYGDFASCGS